MANIEIRGKLMRPDGSRPWSGATIDITYHGYSQTPTEQRPSDRIQTKTALDGTWSISLWKNADGDYQSYYSFKFPNDRAIKIYLPEGTPPEIEFSQLAIASTPPTDPSYPSLIELINSLFVAGDFTATADLIPLNPVIPGLGGTVQSAIAALNTQVQPKRWVFGDADLSVAGFFVVNHGLSTEPSSHEVYFPAGGGDLDPVYPVVAVKNTTALSLDFNGFRPVPSGSILIVR